MVGMVGTILLGGFGALQPLSAQQVKDLDYTYVRVETGMRIDIATSNSEVQGYVVTPVLASINQPAWAPPTIGVPCYYTPRIDGAGGMAGRTTFTVLYDHTKTKLIGLMVVGVKGVAWMGAAIP